MHVFYLSPDNVVAKDLFRVLRALLGQQEFDGWKATPWWDHWETGGVVDAIAAAIGEADIVVADTSGDNPNVMWEVGVAQTLRKPAILMRSTASGTSPFNIGHQQHVEYNHLDDEIGEENEPQLEKRLKQSLRAAAALPVVRAELTERVNIEDLQDGEPVYLQSRGSVQGRVEILEIRGEVATRVAIHFADGEVIQLRSDALGPMRHVILRELRWSGEPD